MQNHIKTDLWQTQDQNSEFLTFSPEFSSLDYAASRHQHNHSVLTKNYSSNLYEVENILIANFHKYEKKTIKNGAILMKFENRYVSSQRLQVVYFTQLFLKTTQAV